MWIAFAFSLLFTLTVGYAAAKNRTARAFILPALDVLQSVPVLGFLSATVAGFMALFPGSLLGVECASIFAIFTGQVWNMTFGFYHSLVSIPGDMQEAASTYGLNRWQRFTTVEVPASMHSLIWNSMMSFGGGWFFVAQSEAISVMNKDIKLPGLGSFMAAAVDRGDNQAAMWAIIAMLVVILATDQLVWRPLLAWADKFKIELTESGAPPRPGSTICCAGVTFFRGSDERFGSLSPIGYAASRIEFRRVGPCSGQRRTSVLSTIALRGAAIVFATWVSWQAVRGVIAGVAAVWHHVPLDGIRAYRLAGRPHDVCA